jgi:DNA repair exonuclease SbcCD ATPase subunit
VTTLQARIGGWRETLKQVKGERNPHHDQYRTLTKQKNERETEQAEHQSNLDMLERRIARTKIWIQGFKEVQLDLIKDALEELEIVTNSKLPDFGLEDWTVKYVVERETKKGDLQRGLSVFIQNADAKSPVRWESWSGGVKQRLRVVGALSLSEVLLARAGVDPDLEVLDEPTRSLSTEGSQNLSAFLADRARQLGRRIMYCDHLASEGSDFTSVLTVTRGKSGHSTVSIR